MQLIVERGRVWSTAELNPKTIALDGAVQGPHIDTSKQIYSFDHHANCLRLVTQATCQQVYNALRLGLNPEGFTVLVNDVDADTVFAAALLLNPEWLRSYSTSSMLSILLQAVGNLDAHGPAWFGACPDMPVIDKAANFFYDWVMQPEKDARKNKTYATVDLHALLFQCVQRLVDFMELPHDERVAQLHSTEVKPLADNAKILQVCRANGENFAVIVESQDFIFPKMYKDGHKVVVAFYTQEDGSRAYTVGKVSDFVDFPLGPADKVGTLLHILASREPGWGGGSTIGGAPRNADGSRSRLSPEEVAYVAFDLIPATDKEPASY